MNHGLSLNIFRDIVYGDGDKSMGKLNRSLEESGYGGIEFILCAAHGMTPKLDQRYTKIKYVLSAFTEKFYTPRPFCYNVKFRSLWRKESNFTKVFFLAKPLYAKSRRQTLKRDLCNCYHKLVLIILIYKEFL